MNRTIEARKTWSEPFRAPVSAPHGPIRLANGDILYLGIKKDSPYSWDGDPEKKITAARSRDDGASWDHDWILRDDGPSWDLGYPSTVELPDGSLFSAYYQIGLFSNRPWVRT